MIPEAAPCRLRNIDGLRAEAVQALAAEAVARAVVADGSRMLAGLEEQAAVPGRGWIVCNGRDGEGVAVFLRASTPSGTTLSQAIGRVRAAMALKPFLRCAQHLTADDTVLSNWRVFRVASLDRELFVAFSANFQTSSFEGTLPAQSRSGTWRAVAELDQRSVPRVGESFGLENATILLPDGSVRCRISIWKEGRIVMQSGVQIQSQTDDMVPVRIDLGSVELSAADISELRRGSRLELETGTEIPCFLRIGSRVLAEGSVSVTDQGVRVTVKRVHED